MTIPNAKYQAKLTEAVLNEYDSGAVQAQFNAIIPAHGVTLRGSVNVVKRDGSLNERGMRDLMKIFGWTAWDWNAWPYTAPADGHDCMVTVTTVQIAAKDQDGQPTGEMRDIQQIQYLDPMDGGSSGLEQKADPKSLAAKYGAKTRALFSPAPTTAAKPAAAATVRPAVNAAPKAPVAPPPPAPVLAATGKTSDMQSCWAAFYNACPRDKGMPERSAMWRDSLARSFPGKPQTDLTPEDWGAFQDQINALSF